MVIFRTLVGSLTGPLTRRFLSLALLMRSVETTNRMSTGSVKTVNYRIQTFFEILDIPRGQGNPDFVNLGWWKGSPGGIVFLISLSDVTHDDIESEGDCMHCVVRTGCNHHSTDICRIPEGSWWSRNLLIWKIRFAILICDRKFPINLSSAQQYARSVSLLRSRCLRAVAQFLSPGFNKYYPPDYDGEKHGSLNSYRGQ